MGIHLSVTQSWQGGWLVAEILSGIVAGKYGKGRTPLLAFVCSALAGIRQADHGRGHGRVRNDHSVTHPGAKCAEKTSGGGAPEPKASCRVSSVVSQKWRGVLPW